MKKEREEIKWFNTVFYPKYKTARAARYEDGILTRIKENLINIFTPWGPRYSWQKRGTTIHANDKETKVLKLLQNLSYELKMNMPSKTFNWIFVGADLYGTRINTLPKHAVAEYFSSLEICIKGLFPDSSFHLWSSFDKDAESFREEVNNNFDKYVDPRLLRRTHETAKMMNGGGDPRKYLIERISEAILMEKTFRPIKVSCAPRYKDDKVDLDLPRLYLLPEELQAPWL